MMAARISVALILYVVSFALILLGNFPLSAEVLFIGLMGFYEFYRMALRKNVRVSLVPGLLCVAAIITGSSFFGEKYLSVILFVSILFILFVFIVRKDFHVSSFLDASGTVLGVLYTGWLLAHVLFIRQIPGKIQFGAYNMDMGAAVLIFVMLLYTGTDVSAFFFGKFFGKHKLCPNISPNKTWAGSIGGMALTLVLGWFLGPVVGLLPWQSVVLSVLVSVFAQLGDIWESVLKRDAGVKDSGRFLASHGGILDRFDSLFFAAPVAYYFWKFFVG